ncbi:MAG: hypothetical protein WB676_14285 [Bryobacteraceae bacterium]
MPAPGFGRLLGGQPFNADRLAKLRELNHLAQVARASQPSVQLVRSPKISAAAFKRQREERRQALSLFSRILPPFVPVEVVLEEPFLIWQLPNPQSNIWISEQYAPSDSFVKFLVDTSEGSDSTQFVFYFWWENEQSSFALVNVNTSLILNGTCGVSAAPSVLFGNSASISLSANLTLLQWWEQPPTQPLYQDSQMQFIVGLLAYTGASLDFGSPDVKKKDFNFSPFNLSYSMLAVPPQSGVLIEVALQMDYSFDGGELDISEYAMANFNSGDNFVMCPFVQLEILTASSVAAPQARVSKQS